MGEVVKFVQHGAAHITPRIVENLLHSLPLMKVEFAQFDAPEYPHLVDQLEFLADAVEDFAEGAYSDLPYNAVAAATFALMCAHKMIHAIPNFTPSVSHADDSSVVRAVLIENERAFAKYAAEQGIDWATITCKA